MRNEFWPPRAEVGNVWAVLVVMSLAADPSVYLRSPIKRPLLSNVVAAARALTSTAFVDSS
eukprot:8712464-Lingulodinium_polyedra.AAC.1